MIGPMDDGSDFSMRKPHPPMNAPLPRRITPQKFLRNSPQRPAPAPHAGGQSPPCGMGINPLHDAYGSHGAWVSTPGGMWINPLRHVDQPPARWGCFVATGPRIWPREADPPPPACPGSPCPMPIKGLPHGVQGPAESLAHKLPPRAGLHIFRTRCTFFARPSKSPVYTFAPWKSCMQTEN